MISDKISGKMIQILLQAIILSIIDQGRRGRVLEK